MTARGLLTMDYYRLLQVAPTADREVIKAAFRVIMNRLNGHPDKGGDPEYARVLIEAYKTLADHERRRLYDDYLRQRAPTQRPKSPPKPAWQAGWFASANTVAVERGIPIDRRASTRVEIHIAVVVTTKTGTQAPGTIHDISRGGAKLAVELPLQENQVVTISTDADRPAFAEGKIVRVVKPDEAFGVRWSKVNADYWPKGLVQDSTL